MTERLKRTEPVFIASGHVASVWISSHLISEKKHSDEKTEAAGGSGCTARAPWLGGGCCLGGSLDPWALAAAGGAVALHSRTALQTGRL